MADTTLYKQIVLEWGQDTDSLIWGMGYSPDNGEHFYVLNTTYGRKYRAEDGDRIWPFIVDKVKAVLDWYNITNKPDLALKTDLTWSNITNKPDVALKSDLTWANISGKPSIPNADDTTTVSSGDLNDYTTTGKYYMPNALSSYTNHPTTGTDMDDCFAMKVDAYHSGDMIVQTIYQTNSGDVWIRQRWSNSWESWRQINFWS